MLNNPVKPQAHKIIDILKPVSYTHLMRLFGNVLGSFVVMELIKLVAPLIVPIPFSF